MREIKFRGKGLFNPFQGFWVYGSFLSLCNRVEIVYLDFHGEEHGVAVDKETIGQFTGFCDADGHEIYEGDILRHKISKRDYVVSMPEMFGSWIVSNKDFSEPCSLRICIDACVVIGNIHEAKK